MPFKLAGDMENEGTEMVRQSGENSNRLSELFAEFANWTHILKDTSLNVSPPSP
ncbi:bifunctional aminoacyl-tRNA synthetase [Ancylobacter sp. 6x-1]|uniref:Bifunctional aminoacyl-tRNA synthetase n=1 Tax=Ancylobacter crimeensis TaxID=2579147 RepID=A0ABT0DBU2_9HYPH|nr:bifunctional aminoacyl-tRNA synthetase [Ancylobacter crimeensis]MCK0197428.1 bifunctional aminoacyl-tRNA synthetase [Ancylobacter crimeensis]